MVMKNKLFTILLCIIIGCDIFAQTDTLIVYLKKNQEHKFGVDLVFENNSNDTISLLTKFRNLSLGGEILPISGICIEYFCNNNPFTFNWGELPPLMFTFSKGISVINPKSKIKLLFNVDDYYKFPECIDAKYEISFLINYVFLKNNSTKVPIEINYYRTNRVIVIESCKR
jgi:hypothetical protein